MTNVATQLSSKVLILEDRYALRHSMVNLGDRAYHVGLHELIRANLDYEIVSGRVKALPWLTSRYARRVSSVADAQRLFEEILTRTLEQARSAGTFAARAAALLSDNWLVRSRPFQRLEAYVRRRYARGLLETLLPYIFKRQYASELVRSIEQADLVIFNGGAFIADHLDKYLPMVLFELYLAKRLGKPVMVVNQTVSIDKLENRAMVSMVYALLDRHLVREPRSRQKLIDLGVAPDRIVQSADAAFGLLPGLASREPAPSGERAESGIVGLCARGDRPVPLEYWAGVAKMLEDEFVLRPVFFFTSEFQDRAAFERIAAAYPVRTLEKFLDYPELIAQLSGFDLVITDRYHAVAFAMLAGTPVVPIDSNTFKTRGLMDLADYPLDVLANDGDLEKARQSIRRALERQSELAAAVSAAAARLATLAASSMSALRLDAGQAQRLSSDA